MEIEKQTKKPLPSQLAQRLFRTVRSNKRLVLASACAVVFLAILEDVLTEEAMHLDAIAWAFVENYLRHDWLTPIMLSFSELATTTTLLVVFCIVAALGPGKRPGWCYAVNLGLVVAINQALKHLIARPRPEGFALASASGFSFPSGHSMAAMAAFGLIIWMI